LEPAASGSFTVEAEWQSIRFSQSVKGRFLCLEALNSFDGGPRAAIAELDAVDATGQPVSKAGWKILWVDSEDALGTGSDAENMLDGQSASYWQTESGQDTPAYPHRVVIDFGESQRISGLRALPRSGDAKGSGRIKDYRVYIGEQPFGLVPPK